MQKSTINFLVFLLGLLEYVWSFVFFAVIWGILWIVWEYIFG